MTRTQSGYYAALVCAVLLCFSPSKAAGYIAPAVVIPVFCIAARSGAALRRLAWILVALGVYIAVCEATMSEFRFENALMASFTYSALLAIAVIPSRGLAGPNLIQKTLKLITIVVVVEVVVGVVQAVAQFARSGSFDLSNGDYVQGTINPTFTVDAAFANPMYAANIALMIIFLAAAAPKRGRRRWIVIGLGFFAEVLAAVVHVIFMAFVAVLLASLYGMRGRKARIRVGVAVTAITVAFYMLTVVMPRNVSSLAYYWNSFRGNRNVRSRMVERAIFDMPKDNPELFFTGLGLGQFNSRAALISTGRYFSNTTTQLYPVTEMSSAQNRYFLDLWAESNADLYGSSTIKPYFSWLSVYTETGCIGVLVVAVMFGVILIRIWRKRSNRPGLAMGIASGVLLFAALGLQENYWEVPQAVLIGLMLLKLLYANLMDGSTRPGPASGVVRMAIRQTRPAVRLPLKPIASPVGRA